MTSIYTLLQQIAEVAGHLRCGNGRTVAYNCDLIAAASDITDEVNDAFAEAAENDNDNFVAQAFHEVVTPQLTPERVVVDPDEVAREAANRAANVPDVE